MAETQTEMTGDRSTSSVVRELVLESSALVHAEVALARTEMKENLREVTSAVAAAAAGAAILTAGLLTLLASAVLALALAWPAWLAALVIGAVITTVGGVLLAGGVKQAKPKQRMQPTRTLESVRRAPDIAPHYREGAR